MAAHYQKEQARLVYFVKFVDRFCHVLKIIHELHELHETDRYHFECLLERGREKKKHAMRTKRNTNPTCNCAMRRAGFA